MNKRRWRAGLLVALAAALSGVLAPATAIARYAIESWLRHQRRAAVREAIAAYAADVAGSREDLDPDLEAASLEAWRPQPKTRRRRSR